MISIKALILAPIYGAFAIIFFIFVKSEGPSIELALWPIIGPNQIVQNAVRYPDKACFDWTYDKERDAYLVTKIFVVERDDGIRFPTDEWRPDLGIPSNDTTTAKAGVRRTIPECVHIPYGARTAPHFWVRGINVYRPWHRLWDLDQPVKSAEFGLINSASNPHDNEESPGGDTLK